MQHATKYPIFSLSLDLLYCLLYLFSPLLISNMFSVKYFSK